MSEQHDIGREHTLSWPFNQAVIFLRQKAVLPRPSPTVFSLFMSFSFSLHPTNPPLGVPIPSSGIPNATPLPLHPQESLSGAWQLPVSSPYSDARGVKTCFQLTLSNGHSLLIQGILLSLPIPVLPSLSPQGLGRTRTGGGPWGARLNANTQPSWKVLALRGQRRL